MSPRSLPTPALVSEDVCTLRAASTEIVRALTGRYTEASLRSAANAAHRAESSLRALRLHIHRLSRTLRDSETT